MSDIFMEVDEALKQEKLSNLWNKYGGLLVGAIIALILGTASYEGYNYWQSTHNIKQTNSFLDVASKAEVSADDLLAVSDNLDDAFKTIAKVRAAGLAFDTGDREKAAKIYASIANDKDLDNVYKKLAAYMTIHVSEDMSGENKLLALQAISTDNANPWQNRAKLDVALMLAEGGKFTESRKYLKEIMDDESAPKTLQQKAQSLDILYMAQDNSAKYE